MRRLAVPLLVLLIFALGATERAQVGGVSTLQVQVSGSGLVTSDPAGISCPSDCSDQVAEGSRVILTAHPAANAFFVGWGGACSGSAAECVLVVNGDKSVTAKFTSLAPPAVTLNDVSVLEGNLGTTTALLTATLARATDDTVTLHYATSDGTANTSDYVPASGTLTFSPGATTATVTVLVTGDTVAEPDEDFFVDLSSPENAAIGDGRGAVTIIDDDPAPPGRPTPTLVRAQLKASWHVSRRFTGVALFEVVQVPAGATIGVRCSGGSLSGCPFSQKKLTIRAAGKARLTGLFAGRKLRVGTKLGVRVTKPAAIGRDWSFTMRPGKVPKVTKLCVPPGGKKPTDC